VIPQFHSRRHLVMASSLDNKNVAGDANRFIGAEPHFWKRYSGHHEFPLSVVSSFLVHLAVGGLLVLILTGALLSTLGFTGPQVPVVPFVVGQSDGDGEPSATDNTRTKSNIGWPREHVQEGPVQSIAHPKTPELTAPQNPKPTPMPDKNDQAREIDLPTTELSRRLTILDRKLSEKLNEQGPREPSKGPVGNPDGTTPGTLRQTRQNRWTLIFDTRDGNDYLRQLRTLGATLAVKDRAGGYFVIRDFDQSPPRGVPADINLIPGLHWLDSKPDSVRSLAVALGLERIPDHVIAFFPTQFENRLRELEKRLGAIDEEKIKETTFRVVKRGRGYDVIVAELQPKR
jgi:hypothetical protein